MSLITVPMTINDGTDDRIYDYQFQEPGSTVVARYNEPTGSSVTNSLIRAMHTTTKAGRERHLLQKTEENDLVDPSGVEPTNDVIIVNVTVEHHRKHSVADIEKQVKLALAIVGTAGFTDSFVRKNV